MNQCDTPCFFGTDGVRGILGQYPMHPEAILKLGWALGQFLSRRFKTGCVLIGKDTRVSGYVLESALESGIASSGFDVLLVGPMPTPAIAYLTQTFRAQAGIVVSASHNLYRDNGIKLFHANGNKLSQADEQAISELMQAPMVIDGNRLGKAERIEDALGRYVEFCKRAVPVDTKLTDFKIVLDVAHGAAYQAAPLVFEELGAQVVTLHNRPNGYNINAGCGSTDPQTLRAHVLKEGADCGLAFDGDGDRLIMVDHLGAVVDGDGILYVLSRYMKRHNLLRQGIVGTMMTNEALARQFAQEGIPFVRAAVGDRAVKEQLEALDGGLGGESSGHIIIRDHMISGDGIIAGLYVLMILAKMRVTLASLVQEVPWWPSYSLNTVIKDQAMRNIFLSEAFEGQIAAIRAQYAPHCRIISRVSGTEPVHRLMIEAEDKTVLAEAKAKIAALMHELKLSEAVSL